MSAKHTPGPWRWVENSVSEINCRCIEIKAGSYWNIGSIQSHPAHQYSDEEAFANARLIAAAPDMLSALEELVSDIDSYLEWAKSNGRANSEFKRIGQAARAAITKAKGGSHE